VRAELFSRQTGPMQELEAVADVDVAAVAALIGDPGRCAMLQALMDGSQRPAGELAQVAGVSAATASGHLRRLENAGLVRVWSMGRHRYYRLSGPSVATALEALAIIAAPVSVTSLRQSRTAAAMREARTCYDHLAGRAGVDLRDVLLRTGALVPVGPRDHHLTATGRALMDTLGVAESSYTGSRRVFARDCLDWTERRPHLAGVLPASMLERFLKVGWLQRRPADRGLVVTEQGRLELSRLGSGLVGRLETSVAQQGN
jgi:DNA-binding transcriptional ArsR family regulator